MKTAVFAAAAALAASVASADPIIVKPADSHITWGGDAGTAEWSDLGSTIQFTSTEHLRFASFWEAGRGFAPTDNFAIGVNWMQESRLGDLWLYTIDLTRWNPCSGRVQFDAEKQIDSVLYGVWLVVDIDRPLTFCNVPRLLTVDSYETPTDTRPIVDTRKVPEPTPVPEPSTILLVGSVAAFLLWNRREG